MSRAGLYVRFPDGVVRYGLYNGTSDIAWAPLYDTLDEAWDAYTDADEFPTEGAVEVDVAADYGDGFSWRGVATRDHLTEGHEPPLDAADGARVDGLPDWTTP